MTTAVVVGKSSVHRILRAYFLYSLVLASALSIFYSMRLDTLAAGHDRLLRLGQLSGITLLALLFLTWVHRWPMPFDGRLPGTPSHVRPALYAVLCLGLIPPVVVAIFVLQGVAFSGDEGAYLVQADFFAHARLWGAVTSVQRYVSQAYIFPIGDKLVAVYAPGWPAILAVSGLAGLPRIAVNPLIGFLTVATTIGFAARQYGIAMALLAGAILAASAFFMFNSTTFYNGSIVALLGVAFAWAATSYLDRPSALSAIGTGVLFSAIATIRHFDALLFAAPVMFAVLRRGTVQHWKMVPVAMIAAVPLFAALFAYFAAVTGNPLVLPQTLENPGNGMLGANWHAARVTEILAGRFVELAEWVSPPFVIALAWALWAKARNRKLRFFDLYGPLFLVGYWFFWADGGFRWGPRYIYPAFPFMALIVAETAWGAFRAARTRGRAVFVHLVVVSVVTALVQVPFLALRGRELISQTQDIYSQVRNAGLHDAVVIAASGTGLIWYVEPGDLARNGPTLDQDVIYAHGPHTFSQQSDPSDIETSVLALRAYFPMRSIWLYTRDRGAAQGHLTRAG